MTKENIVCSRAIVGTGIPLICFEHNDVAEILAPGGIKSLIMWTLMKYSYRRINHLCCVSEGVAKAFRPLVGATPVSVLYNPVDLPPLVESPAFDTPYLLMVGRLVSQKNYPRAIRLFHELVNMGYQGELRIFGEGTAKRALGRLVTKLGLEDRIHFMGYVTSLAQEFRGADALLLTSEWEGFGIVLVEALNQGCRVVSVACPHGPEEILADGAYGLLLPREESGERDARAIIEFLATRQDSHRLRSRAAVYKPEKVMPQLVSLIHDVTN